MTPAISGTVVPRGILISQLGGTTKTKPSATSRNSKIYFPARLFLPVAVSSPRARAVAQPPQKRRRLPALGSVLHYYRYTRVYPVLHSPNKVTGAKSMSPDFGDMASRQSYHLPDCLIHQHQIAAPSTSLAFQRYSHLILRATSAENLRWPILHRKMPQRRRIMSIRVLSRGLKRPHLYVVYMASSQSSTQCTIELDMILMHYRETRMIKDNKEYYRKANDSVCPDKFPS